MRTDSDSLAAGLSAGCWWRWTLMSHLRKNSCKCAAAGGDEFQNDDWGAIPSASRPGCGSIRTEKRGQPEVKLTVTGCNCRWQAAKPVSLASPALRCTPVLLGVTGSEDGLDHRRLQRPHNVNQSGQPIPSQRFSIDEEVDVIQFGRSPPLQRPKRSRQ